MKQLILGALMIALCTVAWADNHGSDDEAAVWSVVEASWVSETSQDGAWPGEYMHSSGAAWTEEWPGVRDAESIASWSRFQEGVRETLNYQLFPHRIVVEGDTAVAMYSVVQVVMTGDERSRESSGLVETLVRTDEGWKFLALTGFDH